MSLCTSVLSRFRFYAKEVQEDAENIPAEKASEKQGARLQKENEHGRRNQRPEEKTCKGQKETDPLIIVKTSDGSSIRAMPYVERSGFLIFRPFLFDPSPGGTIHTRKLCQ